MNTDNKKLILSIDFSVSWKDHWTVGVQILYSVLIVTVNKIHEHMLIYHILWENQCNVRCV